MKKTFSSTLILGALTLFLAAGLIPPALKLAGELFAAPSIGSLLTAYNIRAFVNTLTMGLAVGLFSTAAGFIVAYHIARTQGLTSALARTLFPAALFAPSVMPAIGLIYLIGNNGLFFQTPLYGATGIFLGALIFTLPHTTLQMLLTLQKLDYRLVQAARSLGASEARCFFTVLLPHCRLGLINALLIAFVLTVTDFGVPKLLGGNYPMLATEIYNQAIGNQNYAAASFLSLWLLLPSILAFYFSSKYRNNAKTVQGAGLPPQSCAKNPFCTLTAWALLLFELASILIVIYGSLVTFWPYMPELTLDNYRFRNSTYGIEPWFNSFILAFWVAVLGTLFAFAGAYVKLRILSVSEILKKTYGWLATISLCVPGTVLGLAFALAFSGVPLFATAIGAMALLVFNTLIHLYTVSHMTATNTLSSLDRRFETVGLSLGVTRTETLRRVVIPMSLNGIAEVFCYLFASALTTISAVVFLYTPQTMPAAVAAIQMIDSGFISEGAAMSTLIFISALAVRLIALKCIEHKK